MATQVSESAQNVEGSSESPEIRRVLISVSDKTGLAGFAAGLHSAGVEIYSTGGTRKFLENEDIPVRDVADYTGFPEMMDGRVKTLHPKIFAGILCRHNLPDDMQSLEEHGIVPFELVVVNLYPFQETIARPETTRSQAVEQVDIGGPSLVRAAAKNHEFVTIATSPTQYDVILEQISRGQRTDLSLRRQLMADAFEHTAQYDQVISGYFASSESKTPEIKSSCNAFPAQVSISLEKKCDLRYGENPHQTAAVYVDPLSKAASLVSAKQLNGKELSYNNLLDLDAALAIVRNMPRPSVSVIKHNNPCGAASADSIGSATEKAMLGDPQSAFGSVIAFNRAVDVASAEYLATPGLFVEAIVAPGFDPQAIEILTTKPKWKTNVRLMDVGSLEKGCSASQIRQIEGGMLMQQSDIEPDLEEDWKIVTEAQPDERLMDELRFGWQIIRFVKSNAIALSRDCALCGVGAGQMSRVDSVEIAISKAADRAAGSILSSDAFFPFPDSIHRAAKAGIVAIIQPGGSRKDDEVIAACNEHQLPMIMTGRRHFKH